MATLGVFSPEITTLIEIHREQSHDQSQAS